MQKLPKRERTTTPPPAPRRGQGRNFQGAQYSRLVNSWGRNGGTLDQDLRKDLPALRARSRDLVKNTSFGARAVNLYKTNVVGSTGIQMQMQVQEEVVSMVKGKKVTKWAYDLKANDMLEAAWADWSRMEHCTVHGKYTLKDVEDLAIAHVIIDGEVLLRHRYGNAFKYGYALQVIDPALLDETYNQARTNSTPEVRMGVELNADDKPVAFHFKTRTLFADTFERVRIPAEELLHIFVPSRVDQVRGYPAMAPVLMDMKMLDAYYEAEVTAARMGAAKAGFIKTPTGDEYRGEADITTEDGQTQARSITIEPGMVEELPVGYEFQAYDPQHPTAAFDPFTKALIRAIASGLGLAYHSLANDLEGVNYSSIRAGELENREAFKQLQTLIKSHMMKPVFEKWLGVVLMLQKVKLPLDKYDKFNQAEFHARRWDWVDPYKDLQAVELALKLGLKTHAGVLAEAGKDLQDTWMQLKKEKDLAQELDLGIVTFEKKEAPAVAPPPKEAAANA